MRLVDLLNASIGYFDIARGARAHALAHKSAVKIRVLPQYATVVVAVYVEPYLKVYKETGHWPTVELGRFIFSLFIALMIFPPLYRQTVRTGGHIFVELCLIFSAALGWRDLIGQIL